MKAPPHGGAFFKAPPNGKRRSRLEKMSLFVTTKETNRGSLFPFDLPAIIAPETSRRKKVLTKAAACLNFGNVMPWRTHGADDVGYRIRGGNMRRPPNNGPLAGVPT